jgi:hypothetical protein
MARIDWDKHRRQDKVFQHGSEPSEFEDQTKQIAKAKGFSKPHGPWKCVCKICGGYYDERTPEEHVCSRRLTRTPMKVKCLKCGMLVDPSRLKSHHRQFHPGPWRPSPPRKGPLVRCKICGVKMFRRIFPQHLKSAHPELMPKG